MGWEPVSYKAKLSWERCACSLKCNSYGTFQHIGSFRNKIKKLITINHHIQNDYLFCTSIQRAPPVPFQRVHYKQSFMCRLNSYLLCADTKAALIFLAKASICQTFQQAGSSFLPDCFFNCTRRPDQCLCPYKIAGLHAQADLNMVTHPNFRRSPEPSEVRNACHWVKSYFI